MKPERSSRNALPFGTVLNGVYTVEAELGHGGVGIVYRAKHRELGPGRHQGIPPYGTGSARGAIRTPCEYGF